MIIDFNCESTVSINSLAVNKNSEVKITTRFFSGKMLMFAKLSLMSFIYELVEIFYFPNIKTKEIFQKYDIEKIFPYHILTDTDSTCLMFQIICNVKNNIHDKKFGDVLFEVMIADDIYNRFDTSPEYWEKFNARKPELQKCLGYFEIESINNHCQIVVAVNPKEYSEHFEDFHCNKKHKDVKKGSPGMNFENFTKRIASVAEIENFDNPKNEYQQQQRFSIVGGEMQNISIMKTKLSQANDKRFYSLNGITSLPIGHPYLRELTKYKEEKGNYYLKIIDITY